MCSNRTSHSDIGKLSPVLVGVNAVRDLNWKTVAEFVGITAIVASLVFVGLQMRQAQRIAFAEQQGQLISDVMALDTLITANADLITKLNTKSELNVNERIAADRLLNSLWASAFFGYQRWFYLDHPALEAPVRNFAFTLYENPGLRDLWVERRKKLERNVEAVDNAGGTGAGDRVADLINTMLAMLDESES